MGVFRHPPHLVPRRRIVHGVAAPPTQFPPGLHGRLHPSLVQAAALRAPALILPWIKTVIPTFRAPVSSVVPRLIALRTFKILRERLGRFPRKIELPKPEVAVSAAPVAPRQIPGIAPRAHPTVARVTPSGPFVPGVTVVVSRPVHAPAPPPLVISPVVRAPSGPFVPGVMTVVSRPPQIEPPQAAVQALAVRVPSAPFVPGLLVVPAKQLPPFQLVSLVGVPPPSAPGGPSTAVGFMGIIFPNRVPMMPTPAPVRVEKLLYPPRLFPERFYSVPLTRQQPAAVPPPQPAKVARAILVPPRPFTVYSVPLARPQQPASIFVPPSTLLRIRIFVYYQGVVVPFTYDVCTGGTWSSVVTFDPCDLLGLEIVGAGTDNLKISVTIELEETP